MLKRKKRIKKIKIFLKQFAMFLIQRFFLSCFLIFLLALIFGAVLFYKYGILAQKANSYDFKTFQFKNEIYQEILRVWRSEEKKFKESDFQKIQNPFKRAVLNSEKKGKID